jgi:hypothetical protein
MNSDHSMCHRGIGLISNRGWLGREFDRARGRRDNCAARKSTPPLVSDARLFAWLLAPETAHRQPAPVAVRVRARQGR